jgi:hypothetical protein
MTHFGRIIMLFALVATTILLGQGAGEARQDVSDSALPGVTIETIARGPAQSPGQDLVLLRMTITPDAYVSPSAQPTVTLLSVETGQALLWLLVGGIEVTRHGGAATERIAAGNLVKLDTGDAATFDLETRLSIDNPGDIDATLLIAALAPAGEPLFVAHPPGSFSVETYACPPQPAGASIDFALCTTSDTPLVRWSLRSDRFAAPLGPEDAAITGATTTWEGLPEGRYSVDLTAESFAPGYVDYWIPSSNQVTRQGAFTTHIYYDSTRSRGSIGALVFAAD